MTMPTWVLLAFAVLIVSGCATPTKDAKPVADFRYMCDAEAARFEDWERYVTSPAVWIAGTVRLITARADDSWSPAASVYAQGSIRQEEVGLRFVVSENDPNQLEMELIDSARSQDARVVGTLPATQSVAFTLEIRSSSTMTASVNGESHTMNFSGFTLRRVGLVCSTGAFAFDKISIEDANGHLTMRWSGP